MEAGVRLRRHFSELSKDMLKRIQRLGFQKPTPIQKEVLGPVLSGLDVLAQAPPASGKTLAFLAPVLDMAAKWPANEPILWITPTRELAEQTSIEAHKVRYPHQRVLLLSSPRSLDVLREGHHLVIGTAARMLQALELPGNFRGVKIVVVDEADHMVSKTHKESMDQLVAKLPRARQTLLFSATRPPWLEDALHSMMRPSYEVCQPTEQPTFHADIAHKFVRVKSRTDSALARTVAGLIEQLGAESALVFCPSKHDATVLQMHPWMSSFVQAKTLHSDLQQEERKTIFRQFRKKEIRTLVTTDVAGRGLNLPVDLVIHLPDASLTADTYLHRAGRVRSKGTSVLLVPRTQQQQQNARKGTNKFSSPVRHLEKTLDISFSVASIASDDVLRLQFVEKLAADCEEPLGLDATAFVDDAATLLDAHGPRVLAQALSLLEHRKKHFVWASALSGRTRYTPVLLFDPWVEKLQSRAQVMALLRKVLGTDKDRFSVGRVAMTQKGYVVDLPFEDAKRVLKDPQVKERGVTPMLASVIPEIVTNELKYRLQQRRRTAGTARGKSHPQRARTAARRRESATLHGSVRLEKAPFTRGGAR
eukprot:GEMP01015378.1.p1 GENE.GEMP01015378.1~~GEMP01015378.1.p1  ORF type:complete len:599 (+),score=178.41 GEMP01015378.1:27-1799(+)